MGVLGDWVPVVSVVQGDGRYGGFGSGGKIYSLSIPIYPLLRGFSPPKCMYVVYTQN